MGAWKTTSATPIINKGIWEITGWLAYGLYLVNQWEAFLSEHCSHVAKFTWLLKKQLFLQREVLTCQPFKIPL